MSVYVDKAFIPYGRMKMCHLLADSLNELHAMAEAIGLERRWFQLSRHNRTPHYNLCISKRNQAIKLGAIEIDRRQVFALIKK